MINIQSRAHRPSAHLTLLIALGVGASAQAARAAEPDVCQKMAQDTKETVIAFQPPSTFTICRAGRVESDVVVGRPVSVAVVTDPNTSFRFTVHGLAAQPQRTGLTGLARRSHALAQTLHDLASAEESVDDSSEPLPDTEEGRLRYLRLLSAKMHQSLAIIEREAFDLARATASLRTWCSEATREPISPAPLDQAVHARCAALGTDAAGERAQKLVETIGAFRAARAQVRAAWLSLHNGVPEKNNKSDSAELTGGMDRLRDVATSLQQQARELAPVAEAIAETSGIVHEALRASTGSLPPNRPVSFGRLERPGFAVLQIDAAPVVLFRSAEDWEGANEEILSHRFRFQVVARHYIDVEAGIAMAGGTPGVPGTAVRNGSTILVSRSVSQLVGLLLVDLEPMRFLAPDHPLAGVFRFPVVGLPLSRDPTQNYLVGAGLGWTGIGSVSFGPYISRQANFANGYAPGQVLPMGVSLAGTTTPGYDVGYFFSATVDLLGILHLFIPPRVPTYDALSGQETAATRQ